MIYGIQQWGIRDLCKKNTKKLYRELTERGIIRFEPNVALSTSDEIKAEMWNVVECIEQYNIMRQYGMEIDSIHIFSDNLFLDEPLLFKLVQEIPLKQIVLKMPEELSKERMMETAYTYMKISDDLCQYGIKTALHNDQAEIETRIDGISAYEWMVNICMNKIFMEVDVGWLMMGGLDPETFLWKNRNRISAVHYKDFSGETKESEVIFGQGKIDINACVQFSRATGALQIFDQDRYGKNKLEDIQEGCQEVDRLTQSRLHTISFLNIMDSLTGKVKVLRQYDRVIEAPNWMKTQNSIIYNSEGHIWKYDIDSDTDKMLDSGYCDNCNNDHVISADERYIAIGHSPVKDDWKESGIYIIPVKGGQPQDVGLKIPSFLHGWSPDQKELVYCGFRMCNGKMKADIYSRFLEGGDEKKLTDSGYNDGPEYSPQGDKIWFNSSRSGLMQIYCMNRDGSEVKQLTNNNRNNWFGHVSPDGKKVVYLSFDKDELLPHEHLPNMCVELWMMNSDGTGDHRILSFFGGQGSINVNSWNKDSRYFAFVSYEMLHK